MKSKIILLVLGLLMTSSIWAGNNVICPVFHEGDSVVYESKGSVNSQVAGQTVKMKIWGLNSYVVARKYNDGYLLRSTLLDMKMENENQGSVTDKIMELTGNPMSMLKGIPMEMLVDRFGKATKIINIQSVKDKVYKMCNDLMNRLEKQYPQVVSILSKDALMKQMMNSLTEEMLLKSLNEQLNYPFFLTGKDLTVGNEVSFIVSGNVEGRAKITKYQPSSSGKSANVSLAASSDLTQDEALRQALENPKMKEMMKTLSDEEKKQAIELMKEHLKMHVNVSSTYDFFEDGYLSNNKYNVGIKSKTMDMVIEGTLTCIHH